MEEENELSLEKIEELAEQGDLFLQVEVGNIYAKIRDYRNAFHWYYLGAKQGHAGSQSMVGYFLYHGYGVSDNWEDAIKWLEMAADQGEHLNTIILYTCYTYGQGTKIDEKKASHWLDILENGDSEVHPKKFSAEELNNLVKGRKPPNPYLWWKRAADNGDYHALKLLRFYKDPPSKK
jgi:TPR repeat protein